MKRRGFLSFLSISPAITKVQIPEPEKVLEIKPFPIEQVKPKDTVLIGGFSSFSYAIPAAFTISKEKKVVRKLE